MKFYLDEDLSQAIAVRLRAQGVDAVSSHECGRNGLPDEKQLDLAAREDRCFVTRNRDDLVLITLNRFDLGLPHAGLLIVPSTILASRFTLISGDLLRYARDNPEGLQPYTIDYLKP